MNTALGVNPRKSLGDQAEHEALKAYQQMGHRLISRNYRLKCGELDLILEEERGGALKIKELVIVEVRARTPGRAWETPEESLSSAKRARIWRTTSVFLEQAGRRWETLRFDLAAWDGRRVRIHRNFWWY